MLKQEINTPDGLALLDKLAPAVRKPLLKELGDHEQVVWCSHPLARHYRRLGLWWLGFGVIWLGLCSVFGLVKPSGAALFFIIILMLPGLAMLSAPFWAGTMARSTAYAVTTRRVIIVRLNFLNGNSVLSFPPNRLALIERNERADGSGDLIFERFEEPMGSGSRTVRHGFFGIERVREVEDLIVGTLLEGKRK